jgi:D-sedoheptulose 7-phosphate isomerase
MGSPDDIAFAISTSGNSPNVLRAVNVARERRLVTVGLTGKTGGKLRGAVDHCICIPSDQTPRIQEAHILTGHILCELVEETLFEQN